MKGQLFFLFIAFFGTTALRAQAWQWASQGIGSDADIGTEIAEDAGGNIYVAGTYKSTSISFGSNVLTNSGSTDIFLAKYSPAGSIVWAKCATGSYLDEVTGIAVQGPYIYMTGHFSSMTITFGSFVLTNTTGWSEVFVVKYDNYGTVVWAKNIDGDLPDYATGICADAAGNAYVCGYFYSDTLSFGSASLTLTSSGTPDLYYAKYDPNGNAVWAKKARGLAYGIAASAAGAVFMTGNFGGSIYFDSYQLTGPGSSPLFVIKFDAGGTLAWARAAGAINASLFPKSIAADAGGSSYITGDFANGSFSFGSSSVNCGGSTDAFLLKYDSGGNEQWANGAGGGNDDYSNSVSVAANGTVFIAGSFLSPWIAFGSQIIGTAGAYDLFAAKYDSNGNTLWALSGGGSNSDGARGICATGSVATATGSFSSASLNFGSTILTNSNAGTGDIYVAKLGPTAGISEEEGDNDISLYPNPGSGLFFLASKSRISAVEVTDALGKRIFFSEVNSGNAAMDLRCQENGIYFLRVETGTGIISKKIVILK